MQAVVTIGPTETAARLRYIHDSTKQLTTWNIRPACTWRSEKVQPTCFVAKGRGEGQTVSDLFTVTFFYLRARFKQFVFTLFDRMTDECFCADWP